MALALLAALAPPAHAETRTLKLYYVHTGEKAEIAFKRNGRYLPDGLEKINHILRDWRRNEPTRMDPRLLDLVWAVYQKTGSNEYIYVVCGYRSPETNSMLRSRSRGVAKKSQHMLGKAMDFFIPGVPLKKLREIGLKMEVGGVGYYPTSGSPFVHMDVGNVRHWPRMNRQQLLALFPDGRTLHIPSDGKPLPGYEQALADYRARKGEAPEVLMASASGKRHKGFFASLFGGGADEEEDNSEAATQVASAAPQPAAKGQGAKSLPGVEMASLAADKKGEAATGSLPADDAPLPQLAPRPDLDVGAPAPQTEVALNIPLPTRRPDYNPPPELRPGQTMVASAAMTYGHAGDVIAAVLARDGARLNGSADAAGHDGLEAFTGPLPTARPAALSEPKLIGQLPQARPQLLPETRALKAIPAVVRLDEAGGKEDRVFKVSAPASPRQALLGMRAGTDPRAALASGVRTTPKQDRLTSREAKPAPTPVAVPVEEEIARWALERGSIAPSTPPKGDRVVAFNVVSTAPVAVYNAGFRRAQIEIDPRRFSGNAVSFLSMAKFSAE